MYFAIVIASSMCNIAFLVITLHKEMSYTNLKAIVIVASSVSNIIKFLVVNLNFT